VIIIPKDRVNEVLSEIELAIFEDIKKGVPAMEAYARHRCEDLTKR